MRIGRSCSPGSMSRKVFRQSAAVREPYVQASQIGLQPRILHRNEVRRGARLVEMRMPQPRWRDERATRLPVDAGRIDYVAPGVQPAAQQRVAAGLCVGDQMERDRLVAGWALHLIGWQ